MVMSSANPVPEINEALDHEIFVDLRQLGGLDDEGYEQGYPLKNLRPFC